MRASRPKLRPHRQDVYDRRAGGAAGLGSALAGGLAGGTLAEFVAALLTSAVGAGEVRMRAARSTPVYPAPLERCRHVAVSRFGFSLFQPGGCRLGGERKLGFCCKRGSEFHNIVYGARASRASAFSPNDLEALRRGRPAALLLDQIGPAACAAGKIMAAVEDGIGGCPMPCQRTKIRHAPPLCSPCQPSA